MVVTDAAVEYWRSGQGLGNITPQNKPWPEGRTFAGWLQQFVGPGTVVEFGCGIGRLAPIFTPGRYIGLDICAEAIHTAQAAWPAYTFCVIDDKEPISGGATVLAHTVFLHVPDDLLAPTIARIVPDRVIVSEILGRSWRRPGNPPVFNREIEEYFEAFNPHGFRLNRARAHDYPHYPGREITLLEFIR